MGFWEIILVIAVLTDKLTIVQAVAIWLAGYVVLGLLVVVGIGLVMLLDLVHMAAY